jgi:enoyl-CoA hydratase
VLADEALSIGLANRVVPKGHAEAEAIALAHQLAVFPQACLRNDRRSVYAQWDVDFDAALRDEMVGGLAVIASGETQAGAARFAAGSGRHGRFDQE